MKMATLCLQAAGPSVVHACLGLNWLGMQGANSQLAWAELPSPPHQPIEPKVEALVSDLSDPGWTY
jgi:hypothetical protein